MKSRQPALNPLLPWIVTCFVFLMAFSLFSCQEKNGNHAKFSALITRVDSTIQESRLIQEGLTKRMDSLKPINEFEALKLENTLNLLNSNLNDLLVYRDSLDRMAKENLPAENIMVLAETQADYVRGLASAGNALLQNRSFSFGEWKDGTPKPIADSITTPIQKK